LYNPNTVTEEQEFIKDYILITSHTYCMSNRAT